jgi:hypothetical protein
MGLFVCVALFSATPPPFTVTAIGYLALAEAAYFYVQLIVLAAAEVATIHKRRLAQQWRHQETVGAAKPPLIATHEEELKAPLLSLPSTGKTPSHCHSPAEGSMLNPLL